VSEPTAPAGAVPATTAPAGAVPGTAAPAPAAAPPAYPVHRNITATTFWVGEPSDTDNGHIANDASAWDDHWQEHFGGVDDPRKRNGWRPVGFVPGENPFYVALPYDDLDDNDRAKTSAAAIPWAGPPVASQSVVKNRWVRIDAGGKTAYAQWEDVGPFSQDDFGYVFGRANPTSHANQSAGIDLSPAVTDALRLDGESPVTWQFVDRADVGPGPWLGTVTTSGVDH
jgi:hypothetical protein